jgi:hypothetical protein
VRIALGKALHDFLSQKFEFRANTDDFQLHLHLHSISSQSVTSRIMQIPAVFRHQPKTQLFPHPFNI